MRVEGGRHQIGHRQLLAQVADEGGRAAVVALARQRIHLQVEAALLHVGHHDRGARAHEAAGYGEPDAARRPRDDHRLAC